MPHEHPALELLGEVGEHELDRGRLVDHRLRDPGEALDHAAERGADADERLPPVVQLAPADQDRAELGELALVAGLAVRLHVDDEELRRRQRLGEHVAHPHLVARRPDDLQVRLHVRRRVGVQAHGYDAAR